MNIENNKQILDMFLTEVLPQAATGKIPVGNIKYNIGFNTLLSVDGKQKLIKIDEHDTLPTIEIKNLSSFSEALINYVNEANKKNILWTTPPDDITNADYLKYYLSLIWGNLTDEDAKAPIRYLEKYINFIKDQSFSEYDEKTEIGIIKNLENSTLEIKRVPQPGHFETPYIMEVRLTKKYDDNRKLIFDLPDIRYAVETDSDDNKVGYIYAVQKQRKKPDYQYTKDYREANEKYKKKINRLLYKIQEGVFESETDEFKEHKNSNNDNYYTENITDVSQSALVSLSVIFALMKNEGISKVKAIDYLPIRCHSKEQSYKGHIEFLKSMGADEQEISEHEVVQYHEHMHIQKNITDKFLRNFRRLDHHFDNIDIPILPGEFGSFMHININNPKNKNNCDNLILQQIYDVIANYQEIKNKKL